MNKTEIGGMEATIFMPDYSSKQELAVLPMHIAKKLFRSMEQAPFYALRQQFINKLVEADNHEQYIHIIKEEYEFRTIIEELEKFFHEHKKEEAFPEGKVTDLIG